MDVGDEVYVKSFMHEGKATITYISPGDLLSIQVETAEPDSDGHRVMRFKVSEVTKLNE